MHRKLCHAKHIKCSPNNCHPNKYLTFSLNEYYTFLIKNETCVLVSIGKNSTQKISVTQNQSFYFTIFREFPIKSYHLRL